MNEYEPVTALSRALLERADMKKAIAAHDFGRVFALARSEAKISYFKIAVECGIKPERVGALARGQGSVTTFDKIKQIADALRIPGHMLGLAPRDWESPAVGPGRRDFFKTSAGVGLAASLPDLMCPPVGRRVGSDYPQRLRERTARLRRLDDILGGGDTYRVYMGEFQATKKLLRESCYSQATGRALLSVLAEQAQQAGWAAFDAGRPSDAVSLYKTSAKAASEAEDHELAGNALAYLAYQALPNSRNQAVELADRSCATAGSRAQPGVRALLHERRAWANAVAGDAPQTAAALATAQAALDEADDTPQHDWAAWVDLNELQIMAGRCWTELHRPLRAVPVLEAALAQYDDAHARDKSLYLSWLATAYLQAGEVEQAATVTDRALDLSTEVASVRPRQRLAPPLEQLGKHRSLPAVAAVLEKASVA
ncbi:XRE family transcriptional regulator [Streptomyces sp. NPDC005727]|uniref:XRE family transcriptional regulator n=1 Tax=Streptomyces sp. NPDC005727 TaxID=3157053 RepID=UPI003404C3BF